MRGFRGFMGLVFLLLLVLTQQGCLLAAGAAAGAGTVAYVSGDLEADLEATPEQVIEAVKKAAEQLKFTVEYAHGSAVDGRAKLRTAGDKEIFIKLEARGERRTHVSIRVGTFGDDSLSNQVLAKIRDGLKEDPVE